MLQKQIVRRTVSVLTDKNIPKTNTTTFNIGICYYYALSLYLKADNKQTDKNEKVLVLFFLIISEWRTRK